MKRISRSLICAGAALLALAALAVDAPNQNQPFTLTLAAPEQPLKAGTLLSLHLTIRNTSDRVVDISTGAVSGIGGKIYQVHVLDERGRPAPGPPTPPPAKPGSKGRVVRLRYGSVQGFPLKPGGSVTDWVNITYLYDLSRPGKYKIWIAEPFYRGAHLSNGLVRSNTITVTVVK